VPKKTNQEMARQMKWFKLTKSPRIQMESTCVTDLRSYQSSPYFQKY
jgi:hypothetical protein